MQRYTVYLYLESALNVSGGTSTHHQELIQLYLQHLVFVAPFETLGKVFQNLKKRIQVCLDVEGEQFRHRL
jgi:hypothetical protein